MKILQVTNFFKPSWESGGPARVVYEISRKLVERGHEVTVYTTDGFKSRLDVKKNKSVDVDGIKTYYFRNLSSYLTRAMVLPIPYYLPLVARREIKDFDVIHIHEYRTVLATIVHYYAEKGDVPYILQAHGSLPILIKKQRLKKIFDLFCGYGILKDASGVIALTETEEELYKKIGIDRAKIVGVPNGIDLSEYDKLPERGEFRRKYSISDDDKLILYLGRIHETKGIDLLVKTFFDINKELNNVRLVVCGPDDGYRPSLEKYIQALEIPEKVLITGFVKPEEKMAALVDSDVFVIPSFLGFPVTFLEACACGKPIITTKRGDKLDWIHNKVGFVVDYDKNQLQNAIFKVICDKELGKRFGEEGKKLMEKKFSWDEIVSNIEKVYWEVIK